MGALAVAVAVCWGCSSGVRDECLQLLREGKATRRGQSLLTKCWHFLTTSRGQAINRMVLHTPNPSLRKLAGPDRAWSPKMCFRKRQVCVCNTSL